MDATIRRFRLSQAAGSVDFANFWRAHGANWAEKEASPEVLAHVNDIAARTQSLGKKERATAINDALKQVWTNGFGGGEAYGWDEMGDELPASALVAFVEGASGR